MFLAHYAVAFGAKRVAPRASLGLLVLAAQWLDLIWPMFVLGKLEWFSVDPGITAYTPLDFEHYPYSHSLLAVLGWSLLLGVLVFARGKSRRVAVVVALLVTSHWVLDFISHRPDLPLTITGQTKVGLGLWNSFVGTILAELALFAAGLVIYLKTTKATDGVGVLLFTSFLSVLGMIFLSNVFGPAPDSVTVIAVGALSLWILPLWAWRLDRRREAR